MRRLRTLVAAALLAAAPLLAVEPRPRILLTNDDGITSEGLHAVFVELSRVGEVTVAAPAENQSGVGHAITYQDPIRVVAIPPLAPAGDDARPWYRVSARPATCVRLALTSLLAERPDLVVSGINRGENPGLVAYISGTVGAAREAAFDGIPSIAASQVMGKNTDFRPGAQVVARIATEVLRRGLPRGTFLNVNIPAGEIRGVKLAPHAMTQGHNTYDRRENPRGETYFWNLWEEPTDPGADTDVGFLGRGFVAVTPLRIDANDDATRKALETWDLR